MLRRMIADNSPVIDFKGSSIGTLWQPFLFHGGVTWFFG